MAVQKLSQIALAGSPPALTDVVVGVQTPSTTPVDLLYTIAQLQSVIAALTINSTPITGGASGHVLYDNAGTVGEAANFTIVSGNPNVTSGNSYDYGGSFFAATDANNGIYIGPLTGNFGVVSGANNVCIGNQAGLSLTSGDSNMLIGAFSGQLLTTGGKNSAIGVGALKNEIGGSNNTAVGNNALNVQSGVSNNTAIGFSAGQRVTSGGSTFIGTQSGSTITSGGSNTAIGFQTLGSENTGSSNTVIGSQTFDSAAGSSNNTIVGTSAARNFGAAANNNNCLIGYRAGTNITGGSNNTFLGGYLGPSSTLSGAIAISDGAGNLNLDYNISNSNKWTIAQGLVASFISTAGMLVADSSGNITSNSSAAAASVSAAFIADHRLQVTIGATTYYIAMSTTAW